MKKKETKSTLNYRVMFIFSLLLIISFFSKNPFYTYSILILFLLSILIDTKNGIYLLILYIPHFEYLKVLPNTNFNLLLIMTIFFSAKLFFDTLTTKTRQSPPLLKYILVILIISIISLVINYNNLELVSSYYGLFFISLYLFIVTLNIIDNRNDLEKIYLMLILSAINVTIMILPNVFLSKEFFRGGRLTFANSVRLLGNTLSPAIIILFYKTQSLKSQYLKKIIIYILIVLLLFLLLFTGSRGVFYSILISIGTVQLIQLLKTKKILPFVSMLLGVFILFSAMVIFAKYNHNFSNTIDRVLDIDNNIRLGIWSNALKQMTLSDYLFGRGLNNFAELSLKGGMVSKYGNPYYAHSIYIDTLSSFGMVPTILLLIFLYKIVSTSIYNANILNLTLTLFIIFSYSTHGQVINTFYWLLLGTVYLGSKLNYEMEIKLK